MIKCIKYIAPLAAFVFFLQSCTTTRRFGTTIERDEKNPCQINIIVQVGIQGTDEDVAKVKSDLDNCFGVECFIPCDKDSSKGCKTKVTTVVKKWGSLNDEEQKAFHYVYMINNDGLPSHAYLGVPNAVIGSVNGCVWRRDEPQGTYCHEVLHLCGLEDKYCSRIADAVTGTLVTEVTCVPPPDPNMGACCFPAFGARRCGTPCPGEEHNMMATLNARLSCDNIRDVVKGAGLDNCPDECCLSDKTFARPPDGIHVTPGYLNFGDKNTHFGTAGGSIGITITVTPTIGATIDGGYYLHTEKDNGFKETSSLKNITGGITWLPVDPLKNKSDFTFSLHALAGISGYTQKATIPNGNNYKSSVTSFHLNTGAALDWKLNKSWDIRLFQADYAPTFFYNATQHNFRLSAGVVYKLFSRLRR